MDTHAWLLPSKTSSNLLLHHTYRAAQQWCSFHHLFPIWAASDPSHYAMCCPKVCPKPCCPIIALGPDTVFATRLFAMCPHLEICLSIILFDHLLLCEIFPHIWCASLSPLSTNKRFIYISILHRLITLNNYGICSVSSLLSLQPLDLYFRQFTLWG